MPIECTLTQEQVNHVCELLLAGDEQFIAMLAKAAIASSADVASDMASDDQNVTITADRIRGSAIDLLTDSINEAIPRIADQIRNMPFCLNIKREVTITPKF